LIHIKHPKTISNWSICPHSRPIRSRNRYRIQSCVQNEASVCRRSARASLCDHLFTFLSQLIRFKYNLCGV